MSLILDIDTALDTASVSIARNGEVLAQATNNEQKDHGSFLQSAIQSLAAKTEIALKELDAVAVVSGPGSYTGLRVGMASAKGLCYALGKPLITIGKLELLACQAIAEIDIKVNDNTPLFCPMIDARRMEVFTAIYDEKLNTILPPAAVILNEELFAKIMLKNKIYFFGNGSQKWHLTYNNKNAYYISLKNNLLYMSKLTYNKFLKSDFANLAYVEPLYIKEFYTT